MFAFQAHDTNQSLPGRRPTPSSRFHHSHPYKRDGDGQPDFAVRRSCLTLSSAFRDIYAGGAQDHSYLTLHSCTHRVVYAGHGELLYTQIATTIEAEVERLAASLDHSAPDAEFLRELLAAWKKHCDAASIIDGIVLYLSRTFIKPRSLAPVLELGRRAWRDGVLRRPAGARLRDALLGMARRERAGEAVDVAVRELMAGATKMLVEVGDGLGLYEQVFEAPFLEETRAVCASESTRLLASPCGCGEYLLVRAVEPMLNAEKDKYMEMIGGGEDSFHAALDSCFT